MSSDDPGAEPAGRGPEHGSAPADPTLAELRDAADDALVRVAQGGDTRAFDELVRRYRDKVKDRVRQR